MADEIQIGATLAKLVAVWRRRKWLAILSFAAVFSTAATTTAVLPAIYQSAATVLVVGQQVPVDFVRTTVTGTLDSRLQTISQEILSRSRLEQLIDSFNLYPNVRQQVPVDALVERMRRDIDVKQSGFDRTGGTVAFTIKYQGRDPETVARVANTLASYYIEENMKVRERQATGTADFLRVQLADVKAKLEKQERSVSEFKRRYLGELPAQLDANLATLERLNTQFRLNGEKQMRAREQRQEMAKMAETLANLKPPPVRATTTARSAASGPAPSQANPILARLARLKQELADLRTRFSDRYPDVVQKREEIAALEHELAEMKKLEPPPPPAESVAAKPKEEPVPAGRSPEVAQLDLAMDQMDTESKSLKEEEAQLRAAMGAYQAKVDNTPRRDLEFHELSRDYDSTRELYRTLLKRYEEAQLSENLEQRQKGEQFRILEHAVTPTSPSAPNRSRLLIMGLAGAAGLAVGLVLLAEQLDSSFHSIDELRAATSFPVLASIPKIVTEADVRSKWWRIPLATVAAVCGLVLIVGASYYVAVGNEQLLRLLSPARF
jgi:protein tyrosine kinase modulator